MPNFMVSPFDRPITRKTPPPPNDQDPGSEDFALPTSGWAAMFRGARGQCPRCNDAKLFIRFLKPVAICPRCLQDWMHQQADDFPAYVSILLTGHIMAPIIIALIRDTPLSLAALAAIIVPLMLALMIGFLQPAKGAIIALQWWLGMHGFERERPAPEASDRKA
ncbi:DUF983 domain-containing protein [Sphingopyxis sp. 22461]|uniref:DUF983 domain-containing protein n=1 Tax=Sphingopyxis sp. 22461 TaxID=3453923 RepID=UPI003F84E212